MVFILVVSADPDRDQLRDDLSAQGWWVSVVPNRQSALRAAADHQPEVVIIDGKLAGAVDLVKIFGAENGGPGALVLAPPGGVSQGFELVEAGADELLSSQPDSAQLIEAIERVTAIPHRSTGKSPHLEGRRLTADEIFGDILVEVEEEGSKRAGREPLGRLVHTKSEPLPPVSEPTTPPRGRETLEASQVNELQHRLNGREKGSVEELFEAESALGEEVGSAVKQPAGSPESAISRDLEEPRVSESEETFGQYLLEERIAVGGMAEVWRASMVGLEGFRKTVAIKKILPHLAENEDFVTMFVDEAKLAAQLNHENLVDIYDLGKIEDGFFIAMEYVDGRDLRSILNRLNRRRQEFPVGLACFIGARIAAALDYAHARVDENGTPLGLVHRDVSPRNILISEAGNIRLCDFGVAKAVSSVAQTEIGALKGKIQYMSPEQARGHRVDSRSDVFSLGSVLFEMVTGRRLFVEDSEISLLDAVRSGEVDSPRSVRRDLPESVNGLILRALSRDPEGRFSTAGEMQAELEDALYDFDPKPTQLGLAEWVGGLFSTREVVESESESPSAAAGASGSQLPGSVAQETSVSVASGDLPSAPVAREAGSVARWATAAQRVESAGHFVRADAPEASQLGRSIADMARKALGARWKFWLGVAAGLVLAVLAALVIDRLLDEAASAPVELAVPASEEKMRRTEPRDGSTSRSSPSDETARRE